MARPALHLAKPGVAVLNVLILPKESVERNGGSMVAIKW